MHKNPIYKTWIRKKKIFIFMLISLCLILVAVLPISSILKVIAITLAIPFIYIVCILIYSYYQFASFGGDFQCKIHYLIVDTIKWDGKGKLLDIGTGSGSLITKLAKRFTEATFTGIDYWGDNWEYSKMLCEENCEIEGVASKIEFIKASASKLPFEDSEFDAAVSCLTFHEVNDNENKIEVLKEALRVVKPNGAFIFLDLFLDKKSFGDNQLLLKSLKEVGIRELKVQKLDEMIKLPTILLHKKVLGNAMVIYGMK